MLGISQCNFVLPLNNTKNAQSRPQLRLKTLDRDTVSFKANESLFLEQISKLCKRGFNSFVAEAAEAYAHSVNPNDPRIVAEFERIAKDTTIDKFVQRVILGRLKSAMGIGGGKVVIPRLGVDFTK